MNLPVINDRQFTSLDGTLSFEATSALPRVLLLVVSPFQYLCAREYLAQTGNRFQVMVIDAAGHCPTSTQQLNSLYQKYPIDQICRLQLQKQGELRDRIASYAWLVDELAHLSFHSILIGDIRQQWMQDIACSLSATHVVLVDDGAATLPLTDFILHKHDFRLPVAMYQANSERAELAQQLKRELGLNINRRQVEVFSIFDLGLANCSPKNSFNLVKSGWTQPPAPLNEWHFIGSPVCEKRIISTELYYSMLENAVKRNTEQGKAIYLSHRSEEMTQKAAFLAELGFEIRQNDLPYELYIIEQQIIPRVVMGMHSTCLFNMKLIFGDAVSAHCYLINETELDKLRGIPWASDQYSLYDHITSIYQRLSDFGIVKIALE